ncbi:hypothetical protein C5B42_01140 [Candidatus Cerribacteria bacterium 'Amazon FNV 2010 28 9']|uniref:Glycosyl transferase family 1 domain-containing protein n=1 Tax=Candidatus Cerribacteria bacterium 'Amazon FNV 2010 28 9' TaxID=2081795 RepID=A0A317JR37_9BACT|nr:MAG: hypothetical protein C5B42_01140 [Candidatus Cerribacteria bacterium 'Amazon FNV 2010 28 9']
MKQPSVVIIYDRVNKFGGAERVLLALHELFPQSVLITSVFDPSKARWVGNWEVRTSFLQHVPLAKAHHEWFALLMPLAFESLDLHKFDVIISVTSEAAKYVITSPMQLHICYCLTPTRYLWSHTQEYEGRSWRWVKRLCFSWLRSRDYIAAQRPDVMIPISTLVKKRIEKYYSRSCIEVVYPPVEIPKVSSIKSPQRRLAEESEYQGKINSVDRSSFKFQNDAARKLETRNYVLIVSRLVPYKKVDLAIQACLQLHIPLHMVGTGSDEQRLKKIANKSSLITFVGAASELQLTGEYEGAFCLLCPQEEDFGIVSVEAQSYGIPVLSYANSGIAETIIEGKTGILFPEQTSESLVGAIQKAQQISWDRTIIQKNARRFDKKLFFAKMEKIVYDGKRSKENYE